MKVRSFARIEAGGRVPELRSAPPLTLRRVHGRRGPDVTLCLVGSAAGPLAGDDLALDLVVEPGACVRLVATGASIAQGLGGEPARLRMSAVVGARASLVADPGPLVVAEGARIDVGVRLDLAPDATVTWCEVVAFGRSTDAVSGSASIRWDVERAGRPVLRQTVSSSDVGHRVLATVLRTGPDLSATTTVRSPLAVTQKVDACTELTTVMGSSAADVLDVARELAGTAWCQPDA